MALERSFVEKSLGLGDSSLELETKKEDMYNRYAPYMTKQKDERKQANLRNMSESISTEAANYILGALNSSFFLKIYVLYRNRNDDAVRFAGL